MEHHILPSFDEAAMVTTTFDLWMSCGEFNTFSLVVNKMGAISYHFGDFLNSCNNRGHHGFTIKILVCLV
jgi:hypothetical protein